MIFDSNGEHTTPSNPAAFAFSAHFNTTFSNVVVFENGKAIECFEMIDLRNEVINEIQNKNVKIKEERD